MSETSSLVSKLARMMAEASGLNKRGWNAHHKYNYVLSTDVYEATRDLMARHGVILVQRPILEGYQRDGGYTRMTWEFTWMDGATGECISVPWVSEAQDSQDKGANKAATAARKYFLITQLQLPVDQDDADAGPSHHGNGNGKASQPPAPPAPQPDSSAPYRRLAALAQQVHQDPRPFQAVIDTLAAAGIIDEDLGPVTRLTDLPLRIVQAGIAHYQTLAGA